MLRNLLVVLACVCSASSAFCATKLVAGDLPGVGVRHRGKIVIKNDRNSISAVQFDGDIQRALVKLRSVRTNLNYRPYGSVLYDGTAILKSAAAGTYQPLIREAAATHGVDPRLIAAVVARESAFNPRAVSPVGAQGLMQLMPATAKFLGVADPLDARQNVFAGARYLKLLLQTFRGDLDLTLAAYNAGPGSVEKHRGIPPFRETIAYVAAVRGTYERSLK